MNKSKLQEFCHQQSWPLPAYETVRKGPDHDPRFTATVTVNGVAFQTLAFVCRSSKEAQNQAAKLAYDHFTAPKTILQRPNPALPEPSTVPDIAERQKRPLPYGHMRSTFEILYRQTRSQKIVRAKRDVF